MHEAMAGASQWPGANFVKGGDASQEHFLKYGDWVRAARELRPGHLVQRHLIDGDIILFNRQPSLHRMSIMAHKAKVRPWRCALLSSPCINSQHLQVKFMLQGHVNVIRGPSSFSAASPACTACPPWPTRPKCGPDVEPARTPSS